MSNMTWLSVINKSTCRVTVGSKNYVITVGHFSKGGSDDASVRRFYNWKGVSLIWYGEIRNLETNKWGHVSAESKQKVIDKLSDYVRNTENLIHERRI